MCADRLFRKLAAPRVGARAAHRDVERELRSHPDISDQHRAGKRLKFSGRGQMTFPTTSDDGRIVLTAEEIAALRKMLDAGDRSGFYLAYYGMTGNSEALLTAKISSFSGNVGGVAFASNWLLQDQYRGAGPAGSSPYAGIYFLSQKVAVAS